MSRAALAVAALWLALTPGAPAEPVDGIPAAPSVAERIEIIRQRLQEALVYPPIALKRGIEGVTHIQFMIAPNGLARDVEASNSSGSRMLDRAAVQCAYDAGPLPRVLGRLDVPIRFSLEAARRRR